MFLAYAKHEQEKEDIIQTILEAIRQADEEDTSFSIQLDDDFSDDEINEIQKEVYRRMGMS